MEDMKVGVKLTADVADYIAKIDSAKTKLADLAGETKLLKQAEREITKELEKAKNAYGEESQKVQRLNADLLDNRKAQIDVKEEVKKVNRELSQLNKQEETAAKSIRDNTEANRENTRAMAANEKQAEQTVKSLQRGFSLLKGLIVGYAGKTLFEALVGTNAQYEQYLTSFDVMLDGAEKAQAMMNDLTDFSAKSPLKLDEVSKATQLLLSYGVAEEDVLTRMRQLGDVAQGNAEKLDRVSLAYGQMLAKGKVTGEELRQMTEAGVPMLQSLADVLGVTTAELQDYIEKGQVGIPALNKALENMTSEGGKFFGMMEKQAGTATGMWSTLTDYAEQFSRTVGEETFAYLKDQLAELLEVIRQMKESGELEELAADIGSDIAATLEFVGNFITKLYEMKDVLLVVTGAAVGYKAAMQGLAVVQSVITWTQTLTGTLSSLRAVKAAGITYSTLYKAAILGEAAAQEVCTKNNIKDIAVKGTQVTATNAATGATLSFNTALMANPIGLVVGAIGLLVGALVSYKLMAGEATEETNKLIEEAKELQKTAEETCDGIEKTTASLTLEEKQINDLISTLERLDSKVELTDQEKKELRDTAAKLENKISDLNIEIDSETGHLQTQIGVVKELAEKYMELARAKAYSAKLEEIEKSKLDLQVSNAGIISDMRQLDKRDRDLIMDWEASGKRGSQSEHGSVGSILGTTYAESMYGQGVGEDVLNAYQNYYAVERNNASLTDALKDNQEAYEKLEKEENIVWKIINEKGIDLGLAKETGSTQSGDDSYLLSGGGSSSSSSAKVKEPVYRELSYIYPFDNQYRITSGWRDDKERTALHDAIDIGAPYGTPVKASNAGTVIFAGWTGDDSYGNYVEIDHGNGSVTTYGHLSSIAVSAGQTVDRGQKIGEVGSTGRSTGPHLDFRFMKNGVPQDPNGLFTGEYGTVVTSIESSGSSSQADYDKYKEEQRKKQVEAYKTLRSDKMAQAERKLEMDYAYGYITEEQYIQSYQDRAEIYRAWAEEAAQQEYMSAEERLAIIKDYLEKAEDYELKYYKNKKAYEKDALNWSMERSKEWIAARIEDGEWQAGDNIFKAWDRVIERFKKYYNEDFYDPNQVKEYMTGLQKLVEEAGNSIVALVEKQEEEKAEIKKKAYEREQKAAEERLNRQYEQTKATLEAELSAVKESTNARLNYLNKLKQDRTRKKEDEDSALKLARLETKLAYEHDEGNIKSLRREIENLNEEISDREFDRWIEAEKEKANQNLEIQTASINELIDREEARKKAMIDTIAEYYTAKMSEAVVNTEAIAFAQQLTDPEFWTAFKTNLGTNLPEQTLQDMTGLFDTIIVDGQEMAMGTVADRVSAMHRQLEQYFGNRSGGGVVNQYKTDRSVTNINTTYQLRDLSPAQITKAKVQNLKAYKRSGFLL